MFRSLLIILCILLSAAGTVAQNHIGIGTTDPQKELDIRGSLRVTRASSASEPHLEVNGSTPGDAFGRIKFSSDAAGTDNFWMLAGRSFDGDDPASRFNIFYNGDSTLGNRFSILGNGKIGINTTPSDRLHIVSDGDEHALRVMIGGSTKLRVLSNGGTAIGLNNVAGTPQDGLFVNGNVGLGVSNPTDKLAVNGDTDINGLAKVNTLAVGQSAVHPSAIVEIASGNAGVLIPRMRTSERDLIPAPADGLLLFNTNQKQINIHKDGEWRILTSELAGDNGTTVELDPGTEDGVFFYKGGSLRGRLVYKNANLPVLEFKNSEGNTLIGEDVGDGLNPSGSLGTDNVFIGRNAGRFTQVTSQSVYLGRDAGEGNEDGSRNIFIGNAAGELRQSSTDNIFIGRNAGNRNINKSNNIFIGNESGIATSGAESIHLGNATNGIGERCVYIGHQAGEMKGGNENVVIGYRAGRDSLQQRNTIIGAKAGEIAPSLFQNVLVGYEAGMGSPAYNTLAVDAATIVGYQAGRLNESDFNTFIGYQAGRNHQLGDNNIFIGYQAGRDLQGPNHLVIEADRTTGGLIYGNFSSREVAINWDFGTAIPNTLSVNGNASKSVAGSWLGNSDERLKKNIVPMHADETLDKILAMRGVMYEWNDDKTGVDRPEGPQTGFIAQDVQKVWPDKVSEDSNGYLQTAYGDYDPMFVEAIKALNAKVEAQNELILQLQEEIEALRRESQPSAQAD